MRAMRTVLCALLTVGLAAPAYAQDFNVLGAANMKRKTQDEVDAEKQRNEDYNAAMKKMPNQDVKSDPWGSMRGGDQKQSGQKQKQAAPKQKQPDQKQADQKQKPAAAQ